MGIYAFFNPLEVYLGTIMYIEFHNIIQTDCKVHAIDLVKSSIVHIHTECATYIEIIPITKAPPRNNLQYSNNVMSNCTTKGNASLEM